MVPDIVTNGLCDGVIIKFKLFIGHYIILLKLVPFFFSFIKYDRVSEMEQRRVIGSVIDVHKAFIDNDLLFLGAISSVVVELKSLDEFVLLIGVPLEGLNDGHTSLICLNDIHGQILNEVLVILCDKVTLNHNDLLIIFFILAHVIFP